MENKPWPRLGEDVGARVGYRKLVVRGFQTPDNKRVDFTLIDEGRVVCIFPLTKDRQVVLAKQFRPGPEQILLELPGGVINLDETPEEAAVRELLEETGYRGKLQLVTESFHSAYSTMQRYNFVATECEKVDEPNTPDDEEFTEVELMPLDQFREHVRSGKLTDMGTGYRALDFLDLL